jgi:hypothetical protein
LLLLLLVLLLNPAGMFPARPFPAGCAEVKMPCRPLREPLSAALPSKPQSSHDTCLAVELRAPAALAREAWAEMSRLLLLLLPLLPPLLPLEPPLLPKELPACRLKPRGLLELFWVVPVRWLWFSSPAVLSAAV